MLRFIKQKIINQLWLSICLFLGFSLLVASFCCRPMFMTGSLNRLLQQMFINYVEEQNTHPTVIGKSGALYDTDILSAGETEDLLQKNCDIWKKSLGDISVISVQSEMRMENLVAQSEYSVKDTTFNICYMPEMLDHIQITKGTDYDGDLQENYFPCMLSEKIMDQKNLVVGESIEFASLENEKEERLKLVVTGVFSEKEENDLFWYRSPNESNRELYVNSEIFDRIVNNYQAIGVDFNYVALLDYKCIDSDNVGSLEHVLEQLTENDEGFSYTFEEMLTTYNQEQQRVGVMLWVMELPILGLVFAFIYMISNQIVESERGEIATLKSRGVSRFQVIKIYAIRLSIIAFISACAGIPLGYGFCKLAASTTDFLTFSSHRMVTYRFVPEMLSYGAIAALIGVIFILIPVVVNSKISIVEYQSNYETGKRMFFEKYFLDLILLALSLYLLFIANKSIDSLRLEALSANKMDPMVFLNTCLFIVAAGMVAFRLMHYFVSFIYTLRKTKWKSVSYVSFLQITRTFRKQTFISIFMILTVALGLFNANAARTINQNYEDRIQNSMGADVRIQEQWKIHSWKKDPYAPVMFRYIEPDYSKFETLVKDGLCENVTKVFMYNNTIAETTHGIVNNCMVMGVDTKMFGLTADMKPELYGDRHWYHSLNALALETNGVISSRNLAEYLGINNGDGLWIHKIAKTGLIDNEDLMYVQVVDIVDAWPGYEKYFYEDNEQKERYLAVVNQATLIQSSDLIPYEIWARLAAGVTQDDLYKTLANKGINMKWYDSISKQITVMKDSPKIQITNGMFTLSFIISIGLCAVGFLIYWISSIRQRELLFGVYRAMGMSVRSLNIMLIYEHIFSTFLSVLAGGGVGMAATLLFIKLFGVVYLPEKSILDICVYYEAGDMIKLFSVIGIVIIICLFILRRLIKKMNITQALKMGED